MFPDVVDLGSIPIAALQADPSRFAQTLMVYQRGGTDFDASFSAGVPLRVRAERGPRGDRWQATLTLDPVGLRPGFISGSVVVKTNDGQFSTLSVPFLGKILP